ncbi:MAG TPA: epoxide hydrolase [Acidimicrobiales bacterium]|nr:epoxide hydrolase [Acidimicrobiales bacterium]
MGDGAIEAFRVAVPEAELEDLKGRLRRTRWPEAETVGDWSQGVPLAYLQELCRYWAEEYDWRATEARLNGFSQFRTEIDGLGIHLLHVRSPHDDALPLVMTHGWPGSVVEFLDAIGPLTDPPDPADAFHVVCPSLPGYGFSDRPAGTGWGTDRIAAAWAELMRRLGYDRYGAQGGDWGAAVTTGLAQVDPDHVAGIHLNMPVAGPATGGPELTGEELAALAAYDEHRKWGTGYSRQQSTRPQTLGYGLVDSPAGQCAWIVEKFWAWTDCDGHPENALTRDQMLNDVMLYWLPGTAASSGRLYWESLRDRRLDPVEVPTGCSIFPKEIARLPRSWVEGRFRDLRYWNEVDKGGHFAAFEQPELFVDEVRRFFRLVR